MKQRLKARNSPAEEVYNNALRTGHKLLRVKNCMEDMDLFGLLFFAGGALWHTPNTELEDLASRLESEQTFKQLARMNRGWFSQARKDYDGTIGHHRNLLRIC